jgi:hypothetical protein
LIWLLLRALPFHGSHSQLGLKTKLSARITVSAHGFEIAFPRELAAITSDRFPRLEAREKAKRFFDGFAFRRDAHRLAVDFDIGSHACLIDAHRGLRTKATIRIDVMAALKAASAPVIARRPWTPWRSTSKQASSGASGLRRGFAPRNDVGDAINRIPYYIHGFF